MSEERERLAADLEAGWFGGANDAMPDPWHDLADGLIALGWTRLDEERLARALARHMEDFEEQPESFDSPAAVTANVGRHYREDKATGGPVSPDWNAGGRAIVGESGAEAYREDTDHA